MAVCLPRQWAGRAHDPQYHHDATSAVAKVDHDSETSEASCSDGSLSLRHFRERSHRCGGRRTLLLGILATVVLVANVPLLLAGRRWPLYSQRPATKPARKYDVSLGSHRPAAAAGGKQFTLAADVSARATKLPILGAGQEMKAGATLSIFSVADLDKEAECVVTAVYPNNVECGAALLTAFSKGTMVTILIQPTHAPTDAPTPAPTAAAPTVAPSPARAPPRIAAARLAPTPAPTACLSASACGAAAEQLGLALGGFGYAFAGDYSETGCYTISNGIFAGMAFYGYTDNGGEVSSVDQLTTLSSPKFRINTCQATSTATSTGATDTATSESSSAITDSATSATDTITSTRVTTTGSLTPTGTAITSTQSVATPVSPMPVPADGKGIPAQIVTTPVPLGNASSASADYLLSRESIKLMFVPTTIFLAFVCCARLCCDRRCVCKQTSASPEDDEKGNDKEPRVEEEEKGEVSSTAVGVAFFSKDERREFSQLAPFMTSNPRRMKRIVNSYAVHKKLFDSDKFGKKADKELFREKMLRWTAMCEQWPLRVSWAIQTLVEERNEFPFEFKHGEMADMSLWEYHTRFAEPLLCNMSSSEMGEKWKSDFSKLIILDDDEHVFASLLSKHPQIRLKDLKSGGRESATWPSLLPYTTNLNPAIRPTLARLKAQNMKSKVHNPRDDNPRDDIPKVVRESVFQRPRGDQEKEGKKVRLVMDPDELNKSMCNKLAVWCEVGMPVGYSMDRNKDAWKRIEKVVHEEVAAAAKIDFEHVQVRRDGRANDGKAIDGKANDIMIMATLPVKGMKHAKAMQKRVLAQKVNLSAAVNAEFSLVFKDKGVVLHDIYLAKVGVQQGKSISDKSQILENSRMEEICTVPPRTTVSKILVWGTELQASNLSDFQVALYDNESQFVTKEEIERRYKVDPKKGGLLIEWDTTDIVKEARPGYRYRLVQHRRVNTCFRAKFDIMMELGVLNEPPRIHLGPIQIGTTMSVVALFSLDPETPGADQEDQQRKEKCDEIAKKLDLDESTVLTAKLCRSTMVKITLDADDEEQADKMKNLIESSKNPLSEQIRDDFEDKRGHAHKSNNEVMVVDVRVVDVKVEGAKAADCDSNLASSTNGVSDGVESSSNASVTVSFKLANMEEKDDYDSIVPLIYGIEGWENKMKGKAKVEPKKDGKVIKVSIRTHNDGVDAIREVNNLRRSIEDHSILSKKPRDDVEDPLSDILAKADTRHDSVNDTTLCVACVTLPAQSDLKYIKSGFAKVADVSEGLMEFDLQRCWEVVATCDIPSDDAWSAVEQFFARDALQTILAGSQMVVDIVKKDKRCFIPLKVKSSDKDVHVTDLEYDLRTLFDDPNGLKTKVEPEVVAAIRVDPVTARRWVDGSKGGDDTVEPGGDDTVQPGSLRSVNSAPKRTQVKCEGGEWSGEFTFHKPPSVPEKVSKDEVVHFFIPFSDMWSKAKAFSRFKKTPFNAFKERLVKEKSEIVTFHEQDPNQWRARCIIATIHVTREAEVDAAIKQIEEIDAQSLFNEANHVWMSKTVAVAAGTKISAAVTMASVLKDEIGEKRVSDVENCFQKTLEDMVEDMVKEDVEMRTIEGHIADVAPTIQDLQKSFAKDMSEYDVFRAPLEVKVGQFKVSVLKNKPGKQFRNAITSTLESEYKLPKLRVDLDPGNAKFYFDTREEEEEKRQSIKQKLAGDQHPFSVEMSESKDVNAAKASFIIVGGNEQECEAKKNKIQKEADTEQIPELRIEFSERHMILAEIKRKGQKNRLPEKDRHNVIRWKNDLNNHFGTDKNWLGAAVFKGSFRYSPKRQHGGLNVDSPTGTDLAGYNRYAEALHHVASSVQKCPMVIGLYAQWGSGKSFVMNKLQSQLKAATLQRRHKEVEQGAQMYTSPIRCICEFLQPDSRSTPDASTLDTLLQQDKDAEIEELWDREFRRDDAGTFDYGSEICKYAYHVLQLIWFVLVGCWFTQRSETQKNDQREHVHDIEYEFVWFNSWLYNGTSNLWPALVLRLYQQVEQHYGSDYAFAAKRALLWSTIDRLWWYALVAFWAYMVVEILGTPNWTKFLPATGAIIALTKEFYKVMVESTLSKELEAQANHKDLQEHLGIMDVVKDKLKDIGNLLQRPEDVPTVWSLYLKDWWIPGTIRDKIVKHFSPYSDRKPCRFVLFVDDLDRCHPEKCVEVVSAVSLLCENLPFIIVLAIDPRVVVASIETVNGQFYQETGISGYQYLDKIVQLPFCIPELSTHQKTAVLKGIVSGGAKHPTGAESDPEHDAESNASEYVEDSD